jgi:hypothetical protein
MPSPHSVGVSAQQMLPADTPMVVPADTDGAMQPVGEGTDPPRLLTALKIRSRGAPLAHLHRTALNNKRLSPEAVNSGTY